MKYRSMVCLTILTGLIACANPVEPTAKDLTPKTPTPYPTLPDWQP